MLNLCKLKILFKHDQNVILKRVQTIYIQRINNVCAPIYFFDYRFGKDFFFTSIRVKQTAKLLEVINIGLHNRQK